MTNGTGGMDLRGIRNCPFSSVGNCHILAGVDLCLGLLKFV